MFRLLVAGTRHAAGDQPLPGTAVGMEAEGSKMHKALGLHLNIEAGAATTIAWSIDTVRKRDGVPAAASAHSGRPLERARSDAAHPGRDETDGARSADAGLQHGASAQGAERLHPSDRLPDPRVAPAALGDLDARRPRRR